MTRYTNIGRKRAYLEAGFGNEVRGVHAVSENISSQAEENRLREKIAGNATDLKGKRQTEHGFLEGDTVADDGTEITVTLGEREQGDNRSSSVGRRPFERSQKRRLKRQEGRVVNTVCFACRKKGHSAKDCPKSTGQKSKFVVGICYRCGSKTHVLSRCKKPEDPNKPLPYASCFVCSGKGHLASSCPQNKARGIYPDGGSCLLCGEVSHLARDCPMRKQGVATNAAYVGTGKDAGADEDDFHMFKRFKAQVDEEEKRELKERKTIASRGPVSNVVIKAKKVVHF